MITFFGNIDTPLIDTKIIWDRAFGESIWSEKVGVFDSKV